jgi:AcrR family transcriptional regulator
MVQTVASGAGAETRRREILAAASRLFREKGLHATGMREIAATLGMTAGNLYYYFPSKQELLAWCQEETLAELGERARAIAATDGPAARRLERLIVEHVTVLNEATPGSLAHLEIEEVPAGRRPALMARRKRYERVWRRLIEDGIAAGELRPVDPALATLALLGAVNWTVKWFDAGGAKSARAVGEEFAALLVGGLAAPRAGG